MLGDSYLAFQSGGVAGFALGWAVVFGFGLGWAGVPGFGLGGTMDLGLEAAGGGGLGLRENSAVALRYQIVTEQATMSSETIREISKPVPCFTGAVVIVSGGHIQR